MTTTNTTTTTKVKTKTKRKPRRSASNGAAVEGESNSAMPRHHEDRHASIAEAAYFRAQLRGFAPGHEVEDWIAAEEEVDQRLLGEGRAS